MSYAIKSIKHIEYYYIVLTLPYPNLQVLMSFMDSSVRLSELPLLIDFEAKSIAKKYPKAKARMEEM